MKNDTRKKSPLNKCSIEIQLLYFPGCPHLPKTRRTLHKALETLALKNVLVKEIDVSTAGCPSFYKNWPSPSVLINSRDIDGMKPAKGAACRIYRSGGTPEMEQIIAAIKTAVEKEDACH